MHRNHRLLGLPLAALLVLGASGIAGAAPAPGERVAGGGMLPTVINGGPADRAQTKWFVSWYPGDGGHCGGAIIARRWILTAAHCVVGTTHTPQVWVQVNPRTPKFAKSGYRVDRMIVHPGFLPGNSLPNDIGLLHVTTDLPNARLPLNTAASRPAAGARSKVFGFGATGPKQSQSQSSKLLVGKVVDLTGPTSGTCGKYQKDRFDPAIQICAGGTAKKGHLSRVDACYGDSGGPLVAQIAGKPTIVGIVSSGGDACSGNPAYPGIYTRVSAFAQWVAEAIVGPNLVASAPNCPPPDRYCQLPAGKTTSITITNKGEGPGSWKITTKAHGALRPSATSGALRAGQTATVKVTATTKKKACQALLVSGSGMLDAKFVFLVNGMREGC